MCLPKVLPVAISALGCSVRRGVGQDAAQGCKEQVGRHRGPSVRADVAGLVASQPQGWFLQAG